MKIADVSQISKEPQSITAPQERINETGTVVSFQRHMTQSNEAQYTKYIESLKEQIFAQGEVIKKKADISGFLKYRKLISELVGEAASNAYASSRSDTFDVRGKHKIFVMIKTVNGKLDEMAQEVLKQQEDNIKLLQMVDDIRGLLVDLFL